MKQSDISQFAALSPFELKDKLIEIADLVTEMELVKHPFRSGIKAQIGVEF